ncbi:MAG: CerR family C-terminal domain-containing protein [Pseudorhodobacter sp.]
MTDDSPPSGTRADLLAAGLRLFGQFGFAGTSTRMLAAEAGTNVASIAYHFGGKEALRMACGEEVLRRISAVAGLPEELPDLPPDMARQRLEMMLRALTAFLTRAPQAADTVGFLLRELADRGPTIPLIHDRFFRHKHRELCLLVAMATGRNPDADQTKLLVFSMLGQAVYFRIGQRIVCRMMEWEEYDDAAAQAITDRLVVNFRAILEDTP